MTDSTPKCEVSNQSHQKPSFDTTMSDFTFFSSDFPENPNSNHSHLMDHNLVLSDFEVSDYLQFQAESEEHSTTSATQVESGSPEHPISLEKTEDSVFVRFNEDDTHRSSKIKYENGAKRKKMDGEFKVAFRTKTELEIMDDGFKWRKYGKKKVKNSPHPRNYYHCSSSSAGCQVKKRVERDREDPSYVITTYEGVHNHESPCVVYYNQTPLMVPTGWTLRPSPLYEQD